jgi:hypothetical protein
MTAALVTGQPAKQRLGHSNRPARPAASTHRPGLVARLYAALVRARTREAERRIGAYIHAHGGRLTDDIERRILDDVIKTGPHRFNA